MHADIVDLWAPEAAAALERLTADLAEKTRRLDDANTVADKALARATAAEERERALRDALDGMREAVFVVEHPDRSRSWSFNGGVIAKAHDKATALLDQYALAQGASHD